jgi:hypothetical protein
MAEAAPMIAVPQRLVELPLADGEQQRLENALHRQKHWDMKDGRRLFQPIARLRFR